MAGGGDDAGVGDGLELTLRLGTPTPAPAPAPRNGLTIVYDRRALGAVDAVELQAIAIISMAKNITDDGGGVPRLGPRCSKATIPTWRAAHASAPASQEGIVAPPSLLGDHAGMSMKRSLQRFLEKRKARAASPYGVHRPARPPRS